MYTHCLSNKSNNSAQQLSNSSQMRNILDMNHLNWSPSIQIENSSPSHSKILTNIFLNRTLYLVRYCFMLISMKI